MLARHVGRCLDLKGTFDRSAHCALRIFPCSLSPKGRKQRIKIESFALSGRARCVRSPCTRCRLPYSAEHDRETASNTRNCRSACPHVHPYMSAFQTFSKSTPDASPGHHIALRLRGRLYTPSRPPYSPGALQAAINISGSRRVRSAAERRAATTMRPPDPPQAASVRRPAAAPEMAGWPHTRRVRPRADRHLRPSGT